MSPMNGCELTASITALANTLTCNMTTDEMNLLGVILTQLGDTILTLATCKSICCEKQTRTPIGVRVYFLFNRFWCRSSQRYRPAH